MDQRKIGRYIAGLRHDAGLTQEKLASLIGVTGKTVSRWETGVYMPDIEMLEILARTFSVTIDDIIAGEGRSAESQRQKVASDATPHRSDTFTLNERIAYFRRKWLRDHIDSMVLCAVIVIAAIIAGALLHKEDVIALSPILAVALFIWQRNRMMTYIESRAYREEDQRQK